MISRISCLAAALGTIVGTPLPLFALPASEKELLERAVTANEASVLSIRTFSCRLSTTRTPRGFFPPARGEYWRSSDRVRVKWEFRENTYDMFLKDTILYIVTKSREDRRNYISVSQYQGKPMGFCDAWTRGLLRLSGGTKSSGACLSLKEYVDTFKGELRSVKRGTGADAPYVILTFHFNGGRQEIWLDERANYMIARIVYGDAAGHQKSGEAVVTKFREVAPAVYFPERVETRKYSGDVLKSTEAVVFTGVRANEPRTDKLLAFTLPANAEVHDLIQGQKYRTGSDGKKTGPIEELSRVPSLPVGGGAGRPPTPRTETREEPQSWTRWILSVAVVIFCSSAVLWEYRKWRSARAS